MANDTAIAFSMYLRGEPIGDAAFDRKIINIGKLSTSNLRVNDPNVSRRHAVVEQRENGEWRITDLGSTNGTRVNNKRIVQATLYNGDRVQMGETVLVVHLAQAAKLKAAEVAQGPQQAEYKPVEIEGLSEKSFFEADKGGGKDKSGTVMGLEIALLWGETVLSIDHFIKPQTVTVGEEKGCRFTIPADNLGMSSFPVVEAKDGKFALNLSNKYIEGDVLKGGQVVSLAEAKSQGMAPGDRMLMDPSVRARLRCGDITLLISYGVMPPLGKTSPLRTVEVWPIVFICLSAIVHISFLVILSLLPEEKLKSRIDPTAKRTKMLEVLKIEEEEEEQEEEEEEIEEEKEEEEVEATSDGPADDNAKDSLEDKLTRDRSAGDRSKAREMAMTAGAARALSDSMLDSLLDTSNQMLMDGKQLVTLGSTGEGPSNFAGNIDPFGGIAGGGGGGFIGANSVGGGGEGGDGVIGGLGKEAGTKHRSMNMADRPIKPVAIASNANVSGRLDKKTVQKIIRRNLSGIKWCYQEALQTNKSLSGKVTLSFTILPTGRVSNPATGSSTIDNAKMLNCIKAKMGRWKFPQPKDGGVVKVSYPLILKTR